MFQNFPIILMFLYEPNTYHLLKNQIVYRDIMRKKWTGVVPT
jgi:hypothetical protein